MRYIPLAFVIAVAALIIAFTSGNRSNAAKNFPGAAPSATARHGAALAAKIGTISTSGDKHRVTYNGHPLHP